MLGFQGLRSLRFTLRGAHFPSRQRGGLPHGPAAQAGPTRKLQMESALKTEKKHGHRTFFHENR